MLFPLTVITYTFEYVLIFNINLKIIGVTALPSIYVVVEEEIYKYTGELSKKMLRNFIQDLLPMHLVEKVSIVLYEFYSPQFLALIFMIIFIMTRSIAL